MTFYREPHVACDWPICYLDSRQDLHVYADSAAKIRTILAAMGWTRVLGLDICNHHPDLDKHVPTLATKKEIGWGTGVRGSCSCGWSDTPLGWGSDRQAVVQRWKNHLPEEPNCFEQIRHIREFGVPSTAKPRDKESPA